MFLHFSAVRPRSHRMSIVVLGCAVAMSACGGGGGGSGGGGDTPAPGVPGGRIRVTTFWDPPVNSAVRETGDVAVDSSGAATSRREGRWESYFPLTVGGRKETTKMYVDGRWDQAQQWREWNVDGSIRLDWKDR